MLWWTQKRPALTSNKKSGFRLGFVALGLSGLLLASCETTETNTPTAQEENVTSEDVARDTSAVVGEEITIRNTVESTVGDESFVMETEAGEPILVVNATGQAFRIPDLTIPIQVTGLVEQFAADAVGQEYGIELDTELYADYEGQPVVIAESIALAPTAEDFYEAPVGTYTDQPIALEGDVRVFEETTNAIALFEEGWADDVGILVLGIEPYLQGADLNEGENVVVTGEAQPLSEGLLREANPDWTDAQVQEFVTRYTDRPVIIADGVYPSAVDPAPGS